MTKIIQRHDTAANWSTINPVLALGEMGVETDTNKFKFGDGTTPYNELPYAAGEGGGTGGSGTTITSKDGTTSYNKLALGEGLIVDTGDISWTNPQMSSNSQDGYVASASVSSSVSGSEIWKAFDKDTTTAENAYYTGIVSMPQWIMLECPEPVRLTSCMIMNEVTTTENFRSGYIQGSNDGINFDNLYTITDRPNTTGLQVTYTFDNNTYYKYLRIYFTASYTNGVSIQEIEFSGYVKSEGAVPSLNVSIDEINTLTDRVNTNEANISELKKDKQDKLTAGDGIIITNKYQGVLSKDIHPYPNGTVDLETTYPENEVVVNTQTTLFKNPTDIATSNYTIIYKVIPPMTKEHSICLGRTYGTYVSANTFGFRPNSSIVISTNYNSGNGDWYIFNSALRTTFLNKLNSGEITFKCTRKIDGTTVTKEIQISDDGGITYHPASYFGYNSDAIIVTNTDNDTFFQEYTSIDSGGSITLDMSGIEMVVGDNTPILTIQSKPDNQTIEFNSNGELACTSNIVQSSELQEVKDTKNNNIFDISKFKVVNNPTITDDGVASGFKTHDFITALSNNKISHTGHIVEYCYKNLNIASITGFPYFCTIRCTTTTNSYINLALGLRYSTRDLIVVGSGSGGDATYITCPFATFYQNPFDFKISFNSTTLSLSIYQNGELKRSQSATLLATPLDSYIHFGNRQYNNVGERYDSWTDTIDLKNFSVTVDGKEVFNGLMSSTKPIYDKITTTNNTLSTFQTDTTKNFSAVNSALNEKANLSDLANYVPLATYNALLARVEALENK